MNKQKYLNFEQSGWENRSKMLLVMVVCVLVATSISSLMPLSDFIHSAIECICFIIAILVCCYTFTGLYYKNISAHIDKSRKTDMSQYSFSKFEQTSRLTYFVRYLTALVCASNVVLALLLGGRREQFSSIMLVIHFFYFLFLVVYKAYYLDLIVSFGEETFLSGLYVVKYDTVFAIREIRRKESSQGTIVMFNVLDQKGRIIGYDKFVLSDFLVLRQRTRKI